MKKKSLDKLTPADVVSVYSGKKGKCCCGCSGNHRYNSLHTKLAGQRRGYKVSAAEVNDAFVQKVLYKMQVAAGVEGSDLLYLPGAYSQTIGDRWYVLYLK